MAVCARQPVLFVSHGGGPCFFMKHIPGSRFESLDEESEAADWFRNAAKTHDLAPKSILIISAHYESKKDKEVLVVQNDPQDLLFDYYGFPDYTYELKYPAPLATDLVPEVTQLLKNSGLKPKPAPKDRGLDHGVFIPLKLMFPEANIPVLQVSLSGGLSPATHLQLGRALAPLRDQGVLIVGSGFTTHNMRAFGPGPVLGWAKKFQSWVDDVLVQGSKLSKDERADAISNWEKAPGALDAHPRSEHLMPLFVAAGASDLEPAEKIYETWVGNGGLLSHYMFT